MEKNNFWVTLSHPKYTKPQKGNRTEAVKLRQCLAHIDELETHKSEIELEIFRLGNKYESVLVLIRTVPGFDKNPLTAIQVLSEIGADMSVFPTAKNLGSWAGCCPSNDQSNHKIMSTRISLVSYITTDGF